VKQIRSVLKFGFGGLHANKYPAMLAATATAFPAADSKRSPLQERECYLSRRRQSAAFPA